MYFVMDRSGDVKNWIESGRGVKVWRNADLGSPNVGGLAFTPADTEGAPHWRYGRDPEAVCHDLADFVFFERVRVVAEFTATAPGRKAANRAADKASAGRVDYYAPIGHVHLAYTCEEIEYVTREIIGVDGVNARPLSTRYRFAVVEWFAVDKTDCAPCDVCGEADADIWIGFGESVAKRCRACDQRIAADWRAANLADLPTIPEAAR